MEQNERPADIVQDGRVYRYACTEEKVIGGFIWTRDRYVNIYDKRSYLLVNFVDTGKPADGGKKPTPAPRLSREEIRKYIQTWKERQA